jgi:hypothetical protein
LTACSCRNHFKIFLFVAERPSEYCNCVSWLHELFLSADVSSIEFRHDGLRKHKKKVTEMRGQLSQQHQQIIENGCILLSALMLGTQRTNNEDERSFFE